MLEGDGIVNSGTAKDQRRQFIAEWIILIYASILLQTVRKAWMKNFMNGFK
jgi:hypothetical protein